MTVCVGAWRWRSTMRGQHAGELPPQTLTRTGDEDDFFTDVE